MWQNDTVSIQGLQLQNKWNMLPFREVRDLETVLCRRPLVLLRA